ncbi:MAG: hypothetical protein ACK478_00635 [Flavobacteriales bacterium]|jgi:hypothetical protein
MKTVITLCMLLCSMSLVHAQKAQLLFYGVVEEGMIPNPEGASRADKKPNKTIDRVNVMVYAGGELVSTTTTKENGFYGVLLKTGANYDVVFEKDGYFSKTFVMNCKNIQHPADGNALKCPMDVDLYKSLDNAELKEMCRKPYGICSVNQHEMKWNKEAMTEHRKKFYEVAVPLYKANEH